MSDLAAFRDHARRMATAEHKPDCDPRDQRAQHINLWDADGYYAGERWEPAKCSGCVPDADRPLWVRLADEADAYLSRHTEDDLFGESA